MLFRRSPRGRCTFGGLAVEFDYVDPPGLLLAAAELITGVGVMALAVRSPRIAQGVRWLRRPRVTRVCQLSSERSQKSSQIG